ncbi:extensin family protein [Rhizobium sp. KVB221]|uniref:Extensin family protein n=1 Tax=Rhizobium setariae TaxID=2801340 RepID=A0A936YQH9_9HYPH|nr:extensin family protein [Rhizobium setariae]MBL0374875.1 extensin family protein [Rhizobium setariae]
MSFAFGIDLWRACLPIALSVALTGCSGPMIPPADIDGSSTVSAIEPVRREQTATYAVPESNLDDSSTNTESAERGDYLDTPNLSGVDTKRLPKLDEEPVADQQPVSDQGVNMDANLGVAPMGLAEEQSMDIAEGNTDQPVVDGIGTDAPVEMKRRASAASDDISSEAANSANQITLPSKRRDRQAETQVAFIPRFSDPSQVPESYGGLTSADRACRAELTRMGVRFRDLEPISNGPSCGIAHPIEVTGFAGGIQLKPAAKLNCSMTRIFAKWVKNELVPAAQLRYFSGIKTIYQMSSYSCRKMNSRSRNPWSEHAKGNAIDIGKFVLKSNKVIDVRKKGFFAFREKGLLKTVRSDSCKYFSTVLGPGDAYHGDHFHFDLRYRKSGYRHCSL